VTTSSTLERQQHSQNHKQHKNSTKSCMLKRFAEMQSSSPEKKKSPSKEYSTIIYFRRIVDCESKETLAATVENSYCIKSWLQGKEPRVLTNDADEIFVPATGIHNN
jgi:hypothetical protein